MKIIRCWCPYYRTSNSIKIKLNELVRLIIFSRMFLVSESAYLVEFDKINGKFLILLGDIKQNQKSVWVSNAAKRSEDRGATITNVAFNAQLVPDTRSENGKSTHNMCVQHMTVQQICLFDPKFSQKSSCTCLKQ